MARRLSSIYYASAKAPNGRREAVESENEAFMWLVGVFSVSEAVTGLAVLGVVLVPQAASDRRELVVAPTRHSIG